MPIANHYLQTAELILAGYTGQSPFAFTIKQFFSGQKKYGSRDRKAIAQLCYSYFRLGKAWPDMPVDQKIIAAFFLCQRQPHVVLQQLQPQLNTAVEFGLNEKLSLLESEFNLKENLLPESFAAEIFPWQKLLSNGIDAPDFSLSHLQQPHFFLRSRPGKMPIILKQLSAQNIVPIAVKNDSIALQNGLAIDKIIDLNATAVVQDLSSQQVGEIVATIFLQEKFAPKNMWDCCAASGGKSIMLHDLFPNIQLTVSDIRQSILQNLQTRFSAAGIKNYQAFIADLTKNQNEYSRVKSTFQLIVADVPCTGSGTWARTPEQLFFFDPDSISGFAKRQLEISKNVINQLEVGGYFIYITCSVFLQENEQVVAEMLTQQDLQLVDQQAIFGADLHADSMFVAIIKKIKLN